MIDFHNHVLPSIDDGSQSLEMTLEMLECAYSQGITDVVNTVVYVIQCKLRMIQSFHHKHQTSYIENATDVRCCGVLCDISYGPACVGVGVSPSPHCLAVTESRGTKIT